MSSLAESTTAPPPKDVGGKLYMQGYRPAIVVKKRTPKHVQKGLEAAFRKRQNIKLKASRDEVMAALRRVLNEPCADEGSLRTLFAEVSESLSQLGLSLGGSEDWADRLYIEDKKGGLLFSDDELDVAEQAQKRMELMYNVDAWSTQLVVRVSSGQLLLTSGIEGTREDVLSRVLKRLEEDVRYHSELFDEPTSRLILSRIDEMGLPHSLLALDAQLLDNIAELLVLAMATLRGMVSGCVEQRMKAVRAVAAQKATQALERVRLAVTPMRKAFAQARTQLGELIDQLLGLLDELSAAVTPHLPVQEDDSDEDYY